MSSTGPQLSMMHENLVLVDKKGYETCTVNKTRDPLLNRVILKCDGDASKLKYMQETFSRHRADQDRMKYYPGKTYYFICKYYLLLFKWLGGGYHYNDMTLTDSFFIEESNGTSSQFKLKYVRSKLLNFP